MSHENNSSDTAKLPRLYVGDDLAKDRSIRFSSDQAHYLRSVIRRQPGDHVRVFNGRNGEWLAALTVLGKKGAEAVATERIRPQPEVGAPVHLYFAPIKKNRLSWLVEKAVELGATHLHPVLTQNTEVRRIKDSRIEQQIVEAAEQCERLDVPALSPLLDLDQALDQSGATKMLACLERERQASSIGAAARKFKGGAISILIGPEGGFTEEETQKIQEQDHVEPVSLGSRILRCETAVCYALVAVSLTLSE